MDAIITYVECDKNFKEQYEKYVKKDFSTSRYRSYHVLDLQIKLIRKYMPYIKNIFVVVNDKSQVEEYDDLSGAIIVEHSQIIPSQYLPCFNSCTIEMFLYNIPNLDEQFIYFNDDMFVINKISQLEFFKGAQPVLNPKIKDIPENPNLFEQQCINSTNEILKKLKKENSYKGKYFVQEHICKPYLKRTFSILWSRCKEDITYSLTRTRHKKNYNCYLFNNYDILSDNYVEKKHDYLYIELDKNPIKLKNIICTYDKQFICINDNNCLYNFNILKKKIKEALLWHLNKTENSTYIKEKELHIQKNNYDKIIVTFTSWKNRINSCINIFNLISEQTLIPDKVILNLSIEEFPNKEYDLPKDLIQVINENESFEIYWVKENYKQFKKLIYTLNRFPTDIIISIDDDFPYPDNFIETLYNDYIKNNYSQPISYSDFKDRNGHYTHHGSFTITQAKFYGNYINEILNEFIYPNFNKLKCYDDQVYTEAALLNGYEYKMGSINYNEYRLKIHKNTIDAISKRDENYQKDRKEYLNELFDFIKKKKKNIKNNEKLKIAICAIAKNENLYIREWVEWYKNFGITKIFLYDNNDIDGENFEDVINDYIKEGFVDIINVRGVHKSLEKKYAETTKYHGTQQDCYEECFKKNKSKYDFICFFDIDEFLRCNDINTYLFNHLKLNTDVILLNWIIYGDNENLIYSSESIQKRFKNKSELRQYNQVKSIINCHTNKEMIQIDAHLSLFKDGIYRDSAFNIITPDYKKKIILDNCWLDHYLTKTCEEWILRKYHNTSATGKDYFNQAIDKRIKEFFTFNIDTNEKRNIVNRTITLMDSVNNNIIVSFTSFGERLYNDAPITINSILNQTIKPNKICLTLFNEDVKYIPPYIKNLIDFNVVDLIVVDQNLKPHLKYFYAMQKYRDSIIITIDDDHIYEPTMIENLLNTYKKYPTCVVARRVHLIKRYDNGELLPYKKWKFEYSEQVVPGQNLFATGVGGVLYPPNIFELSDNNLEDIYKCLNADDIYLKWLEVNKHINVVWAPNTSYCGITIQSESAKNNRLQDTNWKGTGNDDYLKIFKI